MSKENKYNLDSIIDSLPEDNEIIENNTTDLNFKSQNKNNNTDLTEINKLDLIKLPSGSKVRYIGSDNNLKTVCEFTHFDNDLVHFKKLIKYNGNKFKYSNWSVKFADISKVYKVNTSKKESNSTNKTKQGGNQTNNQNQNQTNNQTNNQNQNQTNNQNQNQNQTSDIDNYINKLGEKILFDNTSPLVIAKITELENKNRKIESDMAKMLILIKKLYEQN
jgi:hypothetical protein